MFVILRAKDVLVPSKATREKVAHSDCSGTASSKASTSKQYVRLLLLNLIVGGS